MPATGVREAAVEFAARHLKKNPDISMSELRDLGSKEKINIYPLIIGLAKNRLGMGRKAGAAAPRRGPGRPPGSGRGPGRPPGSGRGPGRPPGSGRGPGRPPGSGRGPGRPPGRRGPGRPPSSASDPTAALQNIVRHVQELEREVSSLRGALDRIAGIASGGGA